MQKEKHLSPNDQLKRARFYHGWSQATVAEKIGSDPKTVGRWERGETLPNPFFRKQLCDLFQQEPETLGFVLEERRDPPEELETIHPPVEKVLSVEKQPRQTPVPTLVKYLVVLLSLLVLFMLLFLLIAKIFVGNTPTAFSQQKNRQASPTFTSTTSALSNPYPPYIGTLIFDDPLTENIAHRWPTRVLQTHSARFIDGAYHVQSLGPNYYLASGKVFTNFTYEVQLTLLTGTYAGIVFQADDAAGTYYNFQIDRAGDSIMDRIDGLNGPFTTLFTTSHSSIRTQEPVLIAVVAQKGTFSFYLNHKLVKTMRDATYQQGNIGVSVARSDIQGAGATTAIFRNVKVWA